MPVIKEDFEIQFNLSDFRHLRKNPKTKLCSSFNIISSINMCTTNTLVDNFNTNDNEVFVPQIKVQCDNVWFNPSIDDYPDELKTLVQCLNDSIHHYAVTTSFVILMK